MLPQRQRLEALQESIRTTPRPGAVFDHALGSFPEQRAFVEDESRFLFAFCTRRAAKSYAGALKAYRVATRIPKCSVLIAGLHRDEVKRIWWEPILKDIAERRSIDIKANETELSIRLPNRSHIYLLGMDSDEKQKRKALGQKFALVIIDEAQDWRTDLNELVYSVLKPAVADYSGAIALLGTPGLVARGLFHDVTTGKEPGWTRHEWDTHQNLSIDTKSGRTMASRWAQEIAELEAMKPGIRETSWFKRNYLKQWVIDANLLVYRYQAGRNDFEKLPHYAKGAWTYTLGTDLGYNDATTFVVSAFHEHDRVLYFVEAQSETEMDLTSVSERAKALDRKYGFAKWIVDGANKQAVEEMRRRHDCPWEAADKRGKEDFIELMNAEFMTGGIKLSPECAPLREEYSSLIWDEKKLRETGEREEKEGLPNHATDGALYNWRACYPYLSKPLPKEPEKNSAAWFEAQRQRLQDEADAEMEKEVREMEERQREEREPVESMGDWM